MNEHSFNIQQKLEIPRFFYVILLTFNKLSDIDSNYDKQDQQ